MALKFVYVISNVNSAVIRGTVRVFRLFIFQESPWVGELFVGSVWKNGEKVEDGI